MADGGGAGHGAGTGGFGFGFGFGLSLLLFERASLICNFVPRFARSSNGLELSGIAAESERGARFFAFL